MFIFVYSDFESFFRTYFALVILLSSDFCFSLLYLYPTVLSEHKKAFPAAQRERFWFVFCFIFFFMAIPHNSKCRYGERGVADAKPKAQIILDAAKVSAASGGNSEPKQGQRSQSARGFCPPKHDAGTATRHYRAFWQRRCRAAAAGAVLKPQGGNCAVLPKTFGACGNTFLPTYRGQAHRVRLPGVTRREPALHPAVLPSAQ